VALVSARQDRVSTAPDEDAAGRPADLRSEEERAGRQASCLDPVNGDDGVAEEWVPVVKVERQRDVFSAIAEKIVGELCRRGRIVPAGSRSDASDTASGWPEAIVRQDRPMREQKNSMDGRDAVHRMSLREVWIHGGPPTTPRAGRRPGATQQGRPARLKAGAVGPDGSRSSGHH
jgi:hypothetical protein